MAEWQILSDGGSHEPQQYIDLQNVKQAGPMAIYRQVQVLSQGAAVSTPGVLSTLVLYEYDCMNVKFRTLHEIAYKELWAKGESSVMSPAVGMSEWMTLPQNPLGQMTFDLVCPSGNDSQ